MNNLDSQIVFIYMSEKLNIKDERKVDELFHNRNFNLIAEFSKEIISEKKYKSIINLYCQLFNEIIMLNISKKLSYL